MNASIRGRADRTPYRGAVATLRISTGAASIRHFLAESVVEFRFRRPEPGLEFHTSRSSGESLTALLKDEADLAWVTLGDAPAEGIEQRHVLDLPWLLAMRGDAAYAARVWVDASDLSGLRLIRSPEGTSSGEMLAAALADVSLADDAGVADWDTALLLAELGIGHAIVPALPGWRQLGNGNLKLVPLHGFPPIPVGWAARSWNALPPPARTFTETVNRNCRMRTTIG